MDASPFVSMRSTSSAESSADTCGKKSQSVTIALKVNGELLAALKACLYGLYGKPGTVTYQKIVKKFWKKGQIQKHFEIIPQKFE